MTDTTIRTELIRIYPDADAHRALAAMQEEVRHVWNELVREREHVKVARQTVARARGFVGTPPEMPPRPSLPTPESDEDKAAVRAAWSEYRRACRETGPDWQKYYREIDRSVKDLPELAWRNTPYQHFRGPAAVGNAVLFRDVVKRFRATKRAQYKRVHDHVPLVWGNAPPVRTGGYYGDRRGVPWYNAEIRVNGLVIPGRLRRPLPGVVIQGVTLNKRADGWYAAVKCQVPVRALPDPTLPPIGLDVGQTDLVALSDGYRAHNDRDTEMRQTIAAWQQVADLSRDSEQQRTARDRAARWHQRLVRRQRHWLCAELLPRLLAHEFVAVEDLAKGFRSTGSAPMHMILDAVHATLGERVRAVDPAYTSQTCSQCGNVSKSARQGKRYVCDAPGCGHVQDADVNAARNILQKALDSQAN